MYNNNIYMSGYNNIKPGYNKAPYIKPINTFQKKNHIPIKNIKNSSVEKLFTIVQSSNYDQIMNFVSDENIILNVYDEENETVIHKILNNQDENLTENDKFDLIVFFVNRGVSVGKQNSFNVTALHLACKYQYHKIVSYLVVNQNANTNAVDNSGMTPLHYLVQGKITPCKKKKIVQSLVPDNNNKNNNNNTEISHTAKIIINILYTLQFKKYVTHIKNSIGELKNIYPNDFITYENELINDISNILSNTTMQKSEKVTVITNKSLANITSMTKDMENKFKSVLEPLNITNIDVETNNLHIFIEDLINKFNNNKSSVKTKLNSSQVTINKHIDNLTNKINSIFDNIHAINMNRQFLILNNDTGVDFNEIRDDVFNSIIQHQNPDPDINIPVEIYRNMPILPIAPPNLTNMDFGLNNIEVVRGSKVDQDMWKKNRINARAYPLTDDRGIDPAIVVTKGPILNIADLGAELVPDPDDRLKYYFVSKLYYVINEIVNYSQKINNCIEILNNNIDNNYYYGVYNVINIIIALIINMSQCMVFINNEKMYIKENIIKLYKSFEKAFKNHNDYKYSFSFEHVIDLLINIKNLTDEIYDIFTKLYDSFITLHNNLNSTINLINEHCGITFVNAYFRNGNNPFTVIDAGSVQNVFDVPLLNLNQLPQSYIDYQKIYKTHINDVDDIYIQYMANINDNYKPTYYNDLPHVLGVIKTVDIMSFDIIDLTDVALVALQSLPQNGLIPIVGKLGYNNSSILIDNREDTVLLSINGIMSDYLKILKYNIVQNIMLLFKEQDIYSVHGVPAGDILIDNNEKLINNIVEQKYELEEFIDSNINSEQIILSIVGKIADDILIESIKSLINVNIVRINNNIIKRINNDNIYEIDENTFITQDNGFETSLHKSINDIINKNITKHNVLDLTYPTINNNNNNNNNNLTQYPIFSKNYTSVNDITEQDCYNIDPTIVNILVKNRASINAKDRSRLTPIFYAIDTLHIELVDSLLINGATVNSPNIRNSAGLTPLEYSLHLYKQHSNITTDNIPTIIETFYGSIYNNIKNTIESNKDYKNNIIIYFDNIFPQTLLMYNHMLYKYMMKYIGNWGFDDFEQLSHIMSNYNIINEQQFHAKNIPLITINNTDDKMFKYSTKVYGINEQVDTKQRDINSIQDKISKLYDEIKNITEELKVYIEPLDQDTRTYVNSRTDILNELTIEKDNLIESLNLVKAQEELGKNKLTNVTNAVKANYNTNVLIMKNETDLYKGKLNIGDLYNAISSHITRGADYMLYNELWSNYKQSDLIHPTNIHLLCCLLENKIVSGFNTLQTNLLIVDQLNIICKLYKNVFTTIINDYNDLPKEYSDDNYVLKEVIDIITHVVSSVICANFYYTIRNMLTKYYISVNTYNKLKYANKKEYYKNIRDSINNITSQTKLKKYIIDEIPIKLVKQNLHIYDDNFDQKKNNESTEVLLGNVTNMLKITNVISIDNNSLLIKNITTYIVPYYVDIIQQVVPAMKNVIDNYNRYIMNGYRNLAIVTSMFKKAESEVVSKN
jgi:hypothetical protein